MLLAIFTTAVIVWALGYSMRSERKGGIIDEHRYNNRYNDATGAREDRLG
jgi:hypothetical protein